MSNNNTSASPSTAATAPEAPAAQPRKKWLLRLTGIVIVLGAAYGIYDWMVNSHFEETDNAYVQGNLVQIAPQTAGTVQSILADDTDYVKEGQPLVRLDPADAKVAFEQAKANLAQAVRQVRTLYVNNGSYTAQIAQRQAEVSKAKNDLLRAKRPQAPPGPDRQRGSIQGRAEPCTKPGGRRPGSGQCLAGCRQHGPRAAGQQPVADRRHQRG